MITAPLYAIIVSDKSFWWGKNQQETLKKLEQNIIQVLEPWGRWYPHLVEKRGVDH